jgi:S-DNA-T family DNA segregation ATPase FtsK/SpoIIIE
MASTITPTPKRIRRPRPKSSDGPPGPEPRPRALAAGPSSAPEPAPGTGQFRADLLAIGFCLLGVLLALGLYRPGSAGPAGTFLVHFFRFWMGHVVHVAPLLLFAAGLGLAMDYRRATNLQMVLGVAGILVMLFGCVHLLTTGRGEEFDSTSARLYAMFHWKSHSPLLAAPDGGFFGAAVMSLMFPLGQLGSFITLGAIGLASVLLITELTLRSIAERVHERSRIAAEKARLGAGKVGDRCREAAARISVPKQPPPAQKDLFLDVGGNEQTEEDERQPGGARFGRRRLLRRGEAAEAAAEAPVEPPPALEAAVLPVPITEQVETREFAEAQPAPASRARTRAPRPASRPADAGDYVMPAMDLLDSPSARPKKTNTDTEAHIAILENTLGQFRIQAQVVEIADGPSVTRYEIRLGEGIRVKKILDLADNIAMSLAAMSVRVEAPIPGKAAIGIEVPKKQTYVVTLRECLESQEYREINSRVGFVLGKDVAGNVRCADLAKMPHLLVAGATNSGKSVCLNVLIASMLYRSRPDELKMIMIDPKRVELTLFDGIPHLIHPVVKDVKQAAGILRWVLKEMDRRYDLFAHVMTRNLEGYNEKMAKEPDKKLPYLVVVIDELADLMMQQGPEIEQAICRLAQLARATGIHLVIATQRPSVDVITGLIKANVPSRIAFSVSAQVDSRTILDGKGAENLIGRGDMLFKPVDAAKPTRIQGAFLREVEVERLVEHLKAQGRPEYVAEALSVDHGAYGTASEGEADDDMFEPAARFVVTTGHASTSMIQRKFKIGYTRAARLVDLMESRGIVGSLDGAKPREIRMSRDGLDQVFRDTRNSLYGGADFDDAPDDGDPSPSGPFVDD